MNKNRIITCRTNRRFASVLGILLLITTCSNTQAQRVAAKQAIFTAKSGTNIDFGRVPLGKAQQKTFYYRNTGSETLIIQSLELSSDSAFTIQFATLTLPPKGRGKVIVQFAPQAGHSYSATLSFAVANGVAAPMLMLSGNGTLSTQQNSTATAFVDTTALDAKRSSGTQRDGMH